MFYVLTPVWFVVAWLFFGYLAAAILKYDLVETYPEWRGPDIAFSLFIIFLGPLMFVAVSIICLLCHKKLGMRLNIFKIIIKR
ncbi:MAG: hypothetical protein A2931_03645 [Candidatus Niyogibacteria bacterium RIFCSPLOWO2_01_FULL_45_48]|uniref:Uncharacterized protein n=2 Tax=Candidatus Niyogiibacteriota TaxID=1817912 RepID=A0A1G2EWJ3_9BACT|nr:MAG: hypothetical protein A2835_01385 [Candidatus Niyogibacteria bacterium RIFCSPHIGHO2_01_FULL_45_28]OGZ30176.1 MAG: hypothetical protein A3J00_00720 [Candidatus Niyogibacteria bacterium RIFCSPLOWO2_02_FULL_45_13]OGZ30922.1 MAG: hypothetical protein A2931_03645 [Candidatus Niyogibacteria bacterium RIFCSPLOWO2_01_FULL_45_48]